MSAEPAAPPAPPFHLALVGPTASGKSAAALAIANELAVEIISMDSALVYRDMNIGTAKPTAAERAEDFRVSVSIFSSSPLMNGMMFPRMSHDGTPGYPAPEMACRVVTIVFSMPNWRSGAKPC